MIRIYSQGTLVNITHVIMVHGLTQLLLINHSKTSEHRIHINSATVSFEERLSSSQRFKMYVPILKVCIMTLFQ